MYRGGFCKSTRTTPLLWEFLLSLLYDVECREFIKWIDENQMTFKIVNSLQVANLWGEIKGRPNMDQDKLRRAIRQYYKSGVMKKVKGQKGGYKFEKLPYNPFIKDKTVEATAVNDTSDHTKLPETDEGLTPEFTLQTSEAMGQQKIKYNSYSNSGENTTTKIVTDKWEISESLYTMGHLDSKTSYGDVTEEDFLDELWTTATENAILDKNYLEALMNDIQLYEYGCL